MEIEVDGFKVKVKEEDIGILETSFETKAITVYLPRNVDLETKKALLFHEVVEAITYSHSFALAAEFLSGWSMVKIRLKYDPLFWSLILMYSAGGYFLMVGSATNFTFQGFLCNRVSKTDCG